jgi:tripartite-type tricarboxylate transporter receptor subunit TctC
MRLCRSLRVLIVAASAVVAAATSAGAQPAAVDLAGKTITIVVGFGAGGAYDLYARLAADHLGGFLPGRPTVIVENMPGGGGARSVAYLGTAAPKDGTVASLIPATIVFDSATGSLPAGLTADDFGFVGRLAAPASAVVTWHTSPTKTFADAQRRETTMAGSGRTAITSVILRVLNATVGTKFKVVEGYQGTADVLLAVERGEVEGTSASLVTIESAHPDWIENNQVNFLWLQGAERSSRYPDIPALTEFAETDEQRALFTLITSQGGFGRSLALPPGVPDEIVAAYRSAFDRMVRDPDFIADGERRKLPLDPATGEAVERIVAEALNTPPTTIATLAKILNADAE